MTVEFSGKLRRNIEERHPYLRQWGALALAAKVGDFIPLLCSSPFGSVHVNEGKLQFQKLTCAHAHDNVSYMSYGHYWPLYSGLCVLEVRVQNLGGQGYVTVDVTD